MIIIPWQVGKNLIWDVTMADMLVNSAGKAADLAASRKED